MKIVIVTRSLGQIRKPLTKELVEKLTGKINVGDFAKEFGCYLQPKIIRRIKNIFQILGQR